MLQLNQAQTTKCYIKLYNIAQLFILFSTILMNILTSNLETFIRNLINNADNLGLEVGSMNLDHFGYQASSETDFESLKVAANKIGKSLAEIKVGDRRVAIFEISFAFFWK